MDGYGQYQSLFNDINTSDTISSDTIYFNNAYGLDTNLMTFYDPVIFQGSITLNGGIVLTGDLNMAGFNINNVNRITTSNIICGPSNNIHYTVNSTGSHNFIVNQIETAVRINSLGRVGINTSTPTSLLSITNSTDRASMDISNGINMTVYGINQTNNQLALNTSFGDTILSAASGKKLYLSIGTGIPSFVMDSSGRVGINTQNAVLTNNFRVDGEACIRGTLIINSPVSGRSSTFDEDITSTTTKNYTLPKDLPSTNGAILTSTTAGVMSWNDLNLSNYNRRIFVMTTDGTAYTNSTITTTLSNGTIIGSKTITGGTIQAGDTFHFSGCGKIKFLNNEQLVFNISYGATNNPIQALFNFSPTLATEQTFTFDMYITFRTVGTSGITMGWGSWNCDDATHTYNFNVRLYSAVGTNTTTNKDFNIDATWANASTSNSIQLLSVICHKVY